MDCITFNKNIDAYINDELEDDELNDALNHLEHCGSCREELEINFIVREGVKILDRKNLSYDLSSMFLDNTKHKERYIAGRKMMIRLSYICQTLAFWFVLAAVIVFFRVFNNWL